MKLDPRYDLILVSETLNSAETALFIANYMRSLKNPNNLHWFFPLLEKCGNVIKESLKDDETKILNILEHSWNLLILKRILGYRF